MRNMLLAVTLAGVFALPALGQAPLPQQAPPPVPSQAPPMYPPPELDRIVSPIALYPDPLLAQVLAAATFSPQIPDAARWADQHHYVTGDALTSDIEADNLPWDPSVQALLPFPSVLEMMASAMPWTEELGNAFLAQRPDVMDAVQRMRRAASDYGYLRSNPRVTVSSGPYIEILPANPAFVVVPYYDPLVVYAPPRRGFVVASGINFGFGIYVGPRFTPWGWGATRIGWGERVVFINNAPWGRTWANRTVYVHPYAVRRFDAPRPPEVHRLIERSQREREAPHKGEPPKKEEHKDDQAHKRS
jgi:hypothetical protein